MTKILIITHGPFGQALLSAAEAMLGPQEGAAALGLEAQQGREDLAIAAAKQLKDWGGEALILVDMLGGSPWNAAVGLGQEADRDVLSGVSLPLLEALIQRSTMKAVELGAHLKSMASQSVAQASSLLNGKGPA